MNAPLVFRFRLLICPQENGIYFIASHIFGVFGYIFVDFGKDFEVYDKTGEPEKRGFGELVSKDEKGLVLCLEGKRHDLEDGDTVVFSEVKGMSELNGKEFKIKVKGMRLVVRPIPTCVAESLHRWHVLPHR